MVSQNDITGDKLISKTPNAAYRKAYEDIWGDVYKDNSPLARAKRRDAELEDSVSEGC